MKKQKIEYSLGIVRPKFTLDELKKMLNKNGDDFSDAEIIEIRDLLYNLAEIDYTMFQDYMYKKKEEYLRDKLNE